MILFADNCYSQNKNRYLFYYLDNLCARGIFKEVVINYPIPGHFIMPIDRSFAKIEKKKKKVEKLIKPDEWVDIMKSCNKKNSFKVIFVNYPLRCSLEAEGEDRVVKVMDWKTVIEPRIKSSVPIAKVRTVRFSTNNSLIETRDTDWDF